MFTTCFPKRPSRLLIWVFFVLSFAQLAGTPVRAQDDAERALRGIALLDQRLATVAHRLAVSGAALCPERQPRAGFTVHHLSQYDSAFQGAAIKAFALDARARVLATAAGGPAERAGLQRNDILLEVDGRMVPSNDSRTSGSTELVERIQDFVEESFSDGSAEVKISRNGQLQTIQVEAEVGCATRFHLEAAGEPNARADGRNVIATTGLLMFVQNDAQLAAVLAHELAHNILRHPAWLEATGRSGSRVRETEREADRLSIHLLRRAHYDPAAAIHFWQRLGQTRYGRFSGRDHPGWRQRVDVIGKEIAALERPGTAKECWSSCEAEVAGSD